MIYFYYIWQCLIRHIFTIEHLFKAPFIFKIFQYKIYSLPYMSILQIIREMYENNPKTFVIFTFNPLNFFLPKLAKTLSTAKNIHPILTKLPLSLSLSLSLSLTNDFSHKVITHCLRLPEIHPWQPTSPKFQSRSEIKSRFKNPRFWSMFYFLFFFYVVVFLLCWWWWVKIEVFVMLMAWVKLLVWCMGEDWSWCGLGAGRLRTLFARQACSYCTKLHFFF